MIGGSYRGSEITGSVARQKPLGTDLGDANVWTTTSSGVTGLDALYTAAGANLADGDLGIIDITGDSIIFVYKDAMRNWIRVNPRHNSSQQVFPESAKSYGFRNQDATTVGWEDDGTGYSYSPPDHILTTSAASAYIYTDDLAQSMTEWGCIVLKRMQVDTGATSTPIFSLRRDVSGTRYDLRLTVVSGAWHILSNSGSVNTGISYAQNTEYNIEVYYNYSNNRCWVYQDYDMGSTAVFNTSIILPTTGGTAAGLALQNNSGVLRMEGFAVGHLTTQL